MICEIDGWVLGHFCKCEGRVLGHAAWVLVQVLFWGGGGAGAVLQH